MDYLQKFLQGILGEKTIFQQDCSKCEALSLKEVYERIKTLVQGDKLGYYHCGDTIIIWSHRLQPFFANLLIVVRGKVFYTLPFLDREDLESVRAHLKKTNYYLIIEKSLTKEIADEEDIGFETGD